MIRLFAIILQISPAPTFCADSNESSLEAQHLCETGVKLRTTNNSHALRSDKHLLGFLKAGRVFSCATPLNGPINGCVGLTRSFHEILPTTVPGRVEVLFRSLCLKMRFLPSIVTRVSVRLNRRLSCKLLMGSNLLSVQSQCIKKVRPLDLAVRE
jgi:hypothetical protein